MYVTIAETQGATKTKKNEKFSSDRELPHPGHFVQARRQVVDACHDHAERQRHDAFQRHPKNNFRHFPTYADRHTPNLGSRRACFENSLCRSPAPGRIPTHGNRQNADTPYRKPGRLGIGAHDSHFRKPGKDETIIRIVKIFLSLREKLKH